MGVLDPVEVVGFVHDEVPQPAGRWYGVFPAVVNDVVDPAGQGRVQIELPWVPGYEAWARLSTLMAGHKRGTWFIPDVSDEVLVAFEAGDPRRPYVLGGLWNGQDDPPESITRQNNLKVIRSRNGVRVVLDDADGKERFTVETPGGQKVVLRDGPGAIEITDSNGNSVKLSTSGIAIEAAADVTVKAAKVTVTASMLTVDAPIAKFSGMVQAPVVKADSVIGTSYTPGAGNIW